MQKHSRKHHRGRNSLVNANERVPESASSLLMRIPDAIGDQEDFAVTYLKQEYLSKFCSEGVVPAVVRRKAAIDKWFATEEKNKLTNSRLRGLDRGYNILPRVTFYSFLGFAQRIVANVLGPLTNELVLGTFSGGASTGRRRTLSHPALKFTGMADVTGEAVQYVDVIHHEAELFRELGVFYNLREVVGAELFTVPKKTEIDRCACKEPEINMYLQKAVGTHIRRRLRKFGMDLNDQSKNRRLAQIGSLDGSLATLDLSSASDTITKSCVEALLPRDWFLYLNDIRSRVVVVDGTPVCTEMFSSMGNGFTFELESLLFYALMRATSYFENIPGVISVYGDDIIIPSGMYDSAVWVLTEFGFSINPDKSFATGPFRESCGGHYHDGRDVTPFYLKRQPERLIDLIRVANQLRRWAFADPSRRYELPAIYNVWRELAAFVPRDLWGGRDTSVDTQLVAPCAPDSRLVRVSKRQVLPDLGRYASWQNDNWNRSCEPEAGFTPVATDTLCRKRRAIPGAPTLRDEFYEELTANSVPTR